MSENEELYKTAMDAVGKLYSDCSVDKTQCLANMEGLISEIEHMIEALGEIE